jgi:hypothetical protein
VDSGSYPLPPPWRTFGTFVPLSMSMSAAAPTTLYPAVALKGTALAPAEGRCSDDW